MKILMGLMSPQNEGPPPTSNGSAIATVTALRSRDAGGNVVFAEAIFNAVYTGMDAASSGIMFTGFHIHKGPAGGNFGVVLNTGVAGGAAAGAIDPSGSGTLNYLIPMAPGDGTFAAQGGAINGFFYNPGGFFSN